MGENLDWLMSDQQKPVPQAASAQPAAPQAQAPQSNLEWLASDQKPGVGSAISAGLSNPLNLGGILAGVENVIGNWNDPYEQGLREAERLFLEGKQNYETSFQQQTAGHPFVAGLAQGAVSAPMLGAAPFTVGTGATQAVASGAQYGLANAAGQIASHPTTTSPEEALNQVATDVSTGAASGLATYPFAAGLGWLGNSVKGWFKPTEVGAESLASKISTDELSQLSPNRTVGADLARSQELEQKYPIKFTAGQATGDPEAKLAEQVAATMKRPARTLTTTQAQQLNDQEQIMQMMAKDISANPAKLGNPEVSSNAAKALQENIDTKFRIRTDHATTKYPYAESLAGDKKFSTKTGVTQALNELAELPEQATGTRADLNKALNSLHSVSENSITASGTSTQPGELYYGAPARDVPAATLKDIRIQQQYWAAKAHDYAATTAEGRMSSAKERSLALRMEEALTKVLDEAASDGAAPYAAALRDANETYKADSDAIKAAAPEFIEMLIGKGEAGVETTGPQTLTDKILRASKEQIRGAMRILNTKSPEIADDVRAQAVLDIGTKYHASELGTDLGVGHASRFDKNGAYAFMRDNAGKLEALYEGNPKAQLALRDLLDIFERTSEKVVGVPNQPGAVGAASMATASSTGGITARWGLKTLEAMLSHTKLMAKAVSTPEGIELFKRLMLAAKREFKVGDAEMRAMASEAAKLGWTSVMQQLNEQEQTKPSPVFKQ